MTCHVSACLQIHFISRERTTSLAHPHRPSRLQHRVSVRTVIGAKPCVRMLPAPGPKSVASRERLGSVAQPPPYRIRSNSKVKSCSVPTALCRRPDSRQSPVSRGNLAAAPHSYAFLSRVPGRRVSSRASAGTASSGRKLRQTAPPKTAVHEMFIKSLSPVTDGV